MEICTVGSVRGESVGAAMVDLNGHEAGNGGYGQGRSTARRVLLYSERCLVNAVLVQDSGMLLLVGAAQGAVRYESGISQRVFVLSGLDNFQVGGRRVAIPACELASNRLRAECLVSSPLI